MNSLRLLSGLLWRERDALQLLRDRLLDGPGATGSLLKTISSLELHRAIATREAAVELGMEGEVTLRDLAEHAPPEWAAVLEGHRRALVGLVTAVAVRAEASTAVVAEVDGVDRDLVKVPMGEGTGIQRSLRAFLD